MISIFSFPFVEVEGQVCCDPKEVVEVCFISARDYCFSNKSQCNEYSLDGKYMENSLVKKLESPINFGLDGTSKWTIQIKQLSQITTVEAIDTAGCNIFFMPAVFVDTILNIENHARSFLPKEVLDTIYKWSTACPTNVVIASQGETQRWGYTLSGVNQNPNRPETGSYVADMLHNGAFGTPNTFDQGGSYQGVFSRQPTTGSDVLAKDNRGRPTIVFDRATRDLMAGDIGFFCSSVGELSEGGSLISGSDNDILACNLFELACELAASTKFTYQTFELCDNEPILLPSGEMTSEFGRYVDTLTAFNGCDSIVRTEVKECVIIDMPNIFSPNGDGINDYFNLMGTEKVELLDFKIFNRWGEMVYNNETPTTGWNGDFKNQNAVSDVYVYRIIFRHLLDGREEVLMGDVTLFR